MGNQGVAEVTIQVFRVRPANLPPKADAGADRTVEWTQDPIELDGTASRDPDDDLLSHAWLVANAPSGSFAVLDDPNSATPSFVPDLLGTYLFQLVVSDGKLESEPDFVEITFVDTTPPSLTAPDDVMEECSSPGGTPVDLGTPIVSDTCDPLIAVANDAPAQFPLGDTVVTWTAMDDSGNTTEKTQTVTIVDTTPPDLTLSVSPTDLWPPNHKMRAISADVVATDICDLNPVIRLSSISSSEPDNDISDGNTTDDIQGADFENDDRDFELRAERRGKKSGRTYTIVYEAEDMSGNTTQEDDAVSVAKSRGN